MFFPIPEMTDATEYTELKKEIASFFQYFDANALDCARFFFGSDENEVEIYEGNMNIVDFLEVDMFLEFDALSEEVSEGQRNSTMSHIAGKLIKRYGNTEKSYSLFLKEADKCNPPLSDDEYKLYGIVQ